MKNLIIGLGGMGGRILQKISDIHKNDENTILVALDADPHDTFIIEEKDDAIKSFAIGKPSMIEDYVKEYSHLGVKDWLPYSLAFYKETMMYGAGGMRYKGRLSFFDYIQRCDTDGLEALIKSAIMENSEGGFNVTVVTSLCGGTGAGIFIQLALWLRNFFDGFNCTSVINGIFILPDVFVQSISDLAANRAQVLYLYANTYASLKELNALSKAKMARVRLSDITLDGLYDSESDYDRPVYDRVDFIDYINENGLSLDSKHSYEALVADAITARLYIRRNAPQTITFEDNMAPGFSFLKTKPIYGSFGLSKVIYPTDEIVRFCSLKAVSCTFGEGWLEIDKEISAIVSSSGEDFDKRKEYIRLFETKCSLDGADGGLFDVISKDICNESREVCDGKPCIVYTDKAGDFLSSLRNAVTEKLVSEDLGNLSDINCGDDRYLDLKTVSEFTEAVNKDDRAVRDFINCAESSSKAIAYSILDTILPRSEIEEDLDARVGIFSLLSKEDIYGDIIYLHPLAQRYNIYKLITILEDLAISDVSYLKKCALEGEEGITFDNPRTRAVEMTPLDFLASKSLFESSASFLQTFKSMYGEYRERRYDHCLNYAVDIVMKELATRLSEALKALSSSVESFFSELGDIRVRIDEAIAYEQCYDGRYECRVCSSREDKEAIYERLALNITGNERDFNKQALLTFYSEFSSAAERAASKAKSHANATLVNSLVRYFDAKIMAEHKEAIDLDIISALKLWARLRAERSGAAPEDLPRAELTEIYNAVTFLKRSSAPFVSYNIPDFEDYEDISVRTGLKYAINTEAMSIGGAFLEEIMYQPSVCASEMAPKNELTCYRDVLGISLKCIPTISESLKPAYDSLIYEMRAEVEEGRTRALVNTPHLDKRWHDLLPDIDS